MSEEVKKIAAIIDRVKDRVWQDGYYLDYHRHGKTIAQAILEGGYRREADVSREILEEIKKALDVCTVHGSLLTPPYFDIRKFEEKIESLEKRYTTGLNYQERVSTIRDVEDLYKRVCADPHIKQYRGYTASKSYGYDAETKKVITKDGDFWFDNPSFRGG